MGCNASSQQVATAPARSKSIVSKISRKASRHSSGSLLSNTVAKNRSCVSILSKKMSRKHSFVEEPDESLDQGAEKEGNDQQAMQTYIEGACLTLLESRFSNHSRCQHCGNTGVDLSGGLCKCPYGSKKPPADFTCGRGLLIDVGAVLRNNCGGVVLPRKRLGVRGHYVYASCGLNSVASPAWSESYKACAASASTPDGVLQAVRQKMSTFDLDVFRSSLPIVLAAVDGAINVNIAKERLKLATQSQGEKQLKVVGVVYSFSCNIEAVQFMNWIDIAGYRVVDCQDSALRSRGLEVRTGLSLDGCTVRIASFQSTCRMALDCICEFGCPVNSESP